MVEIVCNQQGENGFKLSSSLRSKRFQSSYSAKVRAGAKKKMEGGGGVEKRKPHSFRFFFTLVPTCSTNSRGNACCAG